MPNTKIKPTFLFRGRVALLAVARGGGDHVVRQQVPGLRESGETLAHGSRGGACECARLGFDDGARRTVGVIRFAVVLHGLGAEDNAEMGALGRGDGHRFK